MGRDGHVWALSGQKATAIWWREGITATDKIGTKWTRVWDLGTGKDGQSERARNPNGASEVAICTNGHVWLKAVSKGLGS